MLQSKHSVQRGAWNGPVYILRLRGLWTNKWVFFPQETKHLPVTVNKQMLNFISHNYFHVSVDKNK